MSERKFGNQTKCFKLRGGQEKKETKPPSHILWRTVSVT